MDNFKISQTMYNIVSFLILSRSSVLNICNKIISKSNSTCTWFAINNDHFHNHKINFFFNMTIASNVTFPHHSVSVIILFANILYSHQLFGNCNVYTLVYLSVRHLFVVDGMKWIIGRCQNSYIFKLVYTLSSGSEMKNTKHQ
jgi:hypothetical protein